MKDYMVELILQPQGKCKYNGRRYITMRMSANDEIEAGNFVKEAIGVLLIPDVLIIVNKVLEG